MIKICTINACTQDQVLPKLHPNALCLKDAGNFLGKANHFSHMELTKVGK